MKLRKADEINRLIIKNPIKRWEHACFQRFLRFIGYHNLVQNIVSFCTKVGQDDGHLLFLIKLKSLKVGKETMMHLVEIETKLRKDGGIKIPDKNWRQQDYMRVMRYVFYI